MNRLNFLLLGVLLLVAEAAVAADVVLLRVLDKATARAESLHLPLNTPIPFMTLAITARACERSAPEEPFEAKAFLEIQEPKVSQETLIFSGWMFASSPSLSAIEHPVYDVWVLDCK